jgi:hypothetical protein
MGMAVAKVLDLTHHLNPAITERRPHTEHPGVYRIESRRG